MKLPQIGNNKAKKVTKRQFSL